MNRDAAQRLEVWLSRSLGKPIRVESAEKRGDGAAREIWAIVVTASGGEQPRRSLRVVGGEAPPEQESNRTPCEEFALLRTAHDAGVHVPRPLVLCEDADVLGAPFFVTDLIGETQQGRRVARRFGHGDAICEHSSSPGGRRDRAAHRSPIRGPATEPPVPSNPRLRPDAGEKCSPDPSAHGRWMQRPEIAAQLGGELARLHRITPPHPHLGFLDPAPSDLPAARIGRFRRRLDAIGEPQPVLEWAMRQLGRNAPEGAGTVLCHGAPGAGSCLVDDVGAIAILNWDRCRWGDPYEDIGAFCAECRRLGSGHSEDGGGTPRIGFLDRYREVSGLDIDEDLVRYWEVMATLGRAVGALEHGHRFVAGGERSVELALAGRRVAEMEIELLVETDRLAMVHAHA